MLLVVYFNYIKIYIFFINKLNVVYSIHHTLLIRFMTFTVDLYPNETE